MERNDLVDGAGLDSFLRHPEDDTRRFILCHRHGAGLFDGQEALRSIAAKPVKMTPKAFEPAVLAME